MSIQVIAKCPECGANIYEGHVRHVCPQIVFKSDEGGYTSSISFQSDLIVLSRTRLDDSEETP